MRAAAAGEYLHRIAVVPPSARVVRVPLASPLSAVEALRCLRGDDRPFALIGAWCGGGAVLGSEPLVVARPHEDPFALLDRVPAVGGGAGSGGFGGGWVGHLGYPLGALVERTWPAPPATARRLPAFGLAFYDHVLRGDATGGWWFEALWTAERADALAARLAELRERLAGPAPADRPFATAGWRPRPGRAGHEAAVAAARELIAAGDVFQVNLCRRLEARLDGDPLDLFCAAAERLAPPYAAFLAGPEGAVASLSPELFLRRRGRRVRTAPIKGTAPLGAGGEALAASSKDRAENTMIVDLARNDLGRVCSYGSVRVRALAEPRALAGVWHLVSEVEGELPAGAGDAALVRAAFPPGSVTGAPKVRAMEIISALESAPRDVYTGAIGYVSPLAGLELNVAIRSFEWRDGRVALGVGGGIVADSDPDDETTECTHKAAPLLAAIGAAPLGERRRRGPRPSPAPPADVPRPDPAAGIFETLLVVDGVAQRLDEHLARLAASLAALYGAAPPGSLADEVRRRAASDGPGARRLRVDVVPAADELRTVVDVTAAPPPSGRALRAVLATVPGGLGAHKWRDRRLVERLRPAGADLVLICDLDGHVLEADRSAVALVESGALVVPPLDGRILPGIGRAALLAEARAAGRPVVEEPVAVERLLRADAVVAVNALRGSERVALPGHALDQHVQSRMADAPGRQPGIAEQAADLVG